MCSCLAPDLGLVPLTEPGQTLDFPKRVAGPVLMVPSRPGSSPVLVSWWISPVSVPQVKRLAPPPR
jgi:hypothetical protein